MTETSKARERREHNGWFTTKGYFDGSVLDIGAWNDPVTDNATIYDIVAPTIKTSIPAIVGDAQTLTGVEPESFDCVYSSHCLEHMVDPSEQLRVWWNAVKPGGVLIIAVPDEDLYEQGIWPSRFNNDHKSTWTIHKEPGESWSPVSHNLRDELQALPNSRVESIELCDTNYNYSIQYCYYILARPIKRRGEDKLDLKLSHPEAIDQSTHDNVEVQIEAVVRKLA